MIGYGLGIYDFELNKKKIKTYSVCHNDEHRLLLENNRRFLCELAYNDIQIR